MTVLVELNLRKPLLQSEMLRNFQYNPRRFNGAVFKTGKGTCLLFRTGKTVVVGVKTEHQARRCVEKLVIRLIGIGHRGVKIGKVETKNIASCFDLGCTIHLQKLFHSLHAKGHMVDLTQELFPALVFRLRGSLVCLVHHTGKIILTGSRHVRELKEILNSLLYILFTSSFFFENFEKMSRFSITMNGEIAHLEMSEDGKLSGDDRFTGRTTDLMKRCLERLSGRKLQRSSA